jgi:hypothetical protein
MCTGGCVVWNIPCVTDARSNGFHFKKYLEEVVVSDITVKNKREHMLSRKLGDS